MKAHLAYDVVVAVEDEASETDNDRQDVIRQLHRYMEAGGLEEPGQPAVASWLADDFGVAPEEFPQVVKLGVRLMPLSRTKVAMISALGLHEGPLGASVNARRGAVMAALDVSYSSVLRIETMGVMHLSAVMMYVRAYARSLGPVDPASSRLDYDAAREALDGRIFQLRGGRVELWPDWVPTYYLGHLPEA